MAMTIIHTATTDPTTTTCNDVALDSVFVDPMATMTSFESAFDASFVLDVTAGAFFVDLTFSFDAGGDVVVRTTVAVSELAVVLISVLFLSAVPFWMISPLYFGSAYEGVTEKLKK